MVSNDTPATLRRRRRHPWSVAGGLLRIITLSVLVLGGVAVAGAPSANAAVGVEIVGLGDDGLTIVRFNSAAPGTILGSTPVGGMGAGEVLLGIDHRPATAQLHALTSAGRVVVINPGTGFLSRTVTLAADPTDATNPFTGLAGTQFGVDFNPFADRLRVVSDSGQNLRIDVDTGPTFTDAGLNGATSGAVGAAYVNSVANPAPANTTLYDIDSSADALLIQNPPNNGTLAIVGAGLGVDTDGRVGFDVDANGVAYASLTVGGSSGLYTVNLATGAVTLAGTIGTGTPLRDISVVPAPVDTPPLVALLDANASIIRIVDPRQPLTSVGTLTVSGLIAGDTLVGIDVRPATDALYALGINGSTGRLYTVDTVTGAATLQAILAADPADATSPFAGLSGTNFAVDFNPLADRLRVITDTDQNLRVNPATGLVTTDDPIAYVDANSATNAVVTAAAYTNSTNPPPASTTLLAVESTLGRLAVQDPPNNGALTAGGALPGGLPTLVSFDISPDNRWALLSYGTTGIGRLDAVELGAPIGAAAAPAGRRAFFGVTQPTRGIAALPVGTAPPQMPGPDGRIKRSGGPLWGNDVYNTDGLNQAVRLRFYAGDYRRVYISIQNDSDADESYTVGVDDSSQPGFLFKYFIGRGSTHISAQIESGSFTTPTLGPGETYLLRVSVHVTGDTTRGSQTDRLVTITSTTDAQQDAVKIIVRRR